MTWAAFGWDRRAALAALVVGLGLRLPRAALRWDEIALAYAAYAGPHAEAVGAGRPLDALGVWVGLHPPLWAALHAVAEQVLPVPAVWLAVQAMLSAAAAAVVGGRFGLGPGLLLATAPVAVEYAGEVNNYPLAALAVAAVLAWPVGRAGGLAGVIAGWSHVLGGAAALGAWLEGAVRERSRPLLWHGLIGLVGGLPVLAGVWARSGDAGTFAQPGGGVAAWVAHAEETFGLGFWALPAVGLAGLGAPGTGPAVLVGVALAGALGAGAAAPHQLPYASLLAVPLAALAAGAGARGGRAARLVIAAVVLVQATTSGLRAAEAARELSQGRAVRRGADEARDRSAPGDIVWLVAPALRPDDDKQAVSPSLWAFSPLAWMPRAPIFPHDPLDHRFGHPRRWRGRVLHTSVELEDAVVDAVLAARPSGARAFVVLSEHAPAGGLEQRVARALRPWAGAPERWPAPGGLGDDLLWVVGPAP